MNRIAVLMTCRNRKALTIRCLQGLSPQLGSEDAIFLVDDGSSDGTSGAVQEWFLANSSAASAKLHLIPGTGNLYWAKGMRLAWETAEKSGDWRGYLWLNDDTELNPNALAQLASEADVDGTTIIVGELVDQTGQIVYGMRSKGLFTGNFVWIPKPVFEELGLICGDYAHAWADSDYAMRAKRKGIAVRSCGVVGHAEGHPNRPSLRGLSFRERLATLVDPKGWCLHDLWLYRRRNWGGLCACFSSLHLLVHVARGER